MNTDPPDWHEVHDFGDNVRCLYCGYNAADCVCEWDAGGNLVRRYPEDEADDYPPGQSGAHGFEGEDDNRARLRRPVVKP